MKPAAAAQGTFTAPTVIYEDWKAGPWQRVISPRRPAAEQLAPGIGLSSILPGGRRGPGGECLANIPGGQTWKDTWLLGSEADPFQLAVPDIRMPANQYWPLHWHDCWIAVIILEGNCIMGDWLMQEGDVLISPPGLEYGPVVVGSDGVQMFEIFARAHLNLGGYATEYHDHPTLAKMKLQFYDRAPHNMRNAGNQLLPNGDEPRIVKSRLQPGSSWDLGDADDPERGVFRDVALKPGQTIEPHHYGDWHAIFVMDGAIEFAGRSLVKNDVLIIEPDAPVADMQAGLTGARLFEVARTAHGVERLQGRG